MDRNPNGRSRELNGKQRRGVVELDVRAVIAHALTTQSPVENFGDLRQPLNAAWRVEVIDPEPAMVILIITGPDAHLEAPVRDLIDGQRLPGEQHRVANRD